MSGGLRAIPSEGKSMQLRGRVVAKIVSGARDGKCKAYITSKFA